MDHERGRNSCSASLPSKVFLKSINLTLRWYRSPSAQRKTRPSARWAISPSTIFNSIKENNLPRINNYTMANPSAMRTAGPEPSTSLKPHEATVVRNPADTSLSQRQALEHANTTSSGYFISQDSAYGNLIIPVLPRFENGEPKTT